ncbi:MAG: hypothetical protein ACJ74W_12870 [Pyrinomonadaceae bacterium]
MKSRVAVFAIALVLLVVQPARAADVTGKWIAQLPGRGHSQRTIIFNFKVGGTKLTGSVSGTDIPIIEGQINGDELSFVVVTKAAGRKVGWHYAGKVAGNEIKFTRTREATGGEVVEFTARRAA